MRWLNDGLNWYLSPGIDLGIGYRLCPAIEKGIPCIGLLNTNNHLIEYCHHVPEWPYIGDLFWAREGSVYYLYNGEGDVRPAVILGRPGYVILDNEQIADLFLIPPDGEGEEINGGNIVGTTYFAAAMAAANRVKPA